MRIKPKNFRTEGARAELDRRTLFDDISNGVTGTTMPAWRAVLTNQQIANVAEYVYGAFLNRDRSEANAPEQDHMHGHGGHHDNEHGENQGSKKN